MESNSNTNNKEDNAAPLMIEPELVVPKKRKNKKKNKLVDVFSDSYQSFLRHKDIKDWWEVNRCSVMQEECITTRDLIILDEAFINLLHINFFMETDNEKHNLTHLMVTTCKIMTYVKNIHREAKKRQDQLENETI